jgi:hypothetical protein
MKDTIQELQNKGFTNWWIVLELGITREQFFKIVMNIPENTLMSDAEWENYNNQYFDGKSA